MLSSIKEYQPGPPGVGSTRAGFGLPSRGAKLSELIGLGLPFEVLDQLATLLVIRRELISKAICISPTRLARLAKAGRFNTLESDRLLAVFEAALSLFENDVVSATRWMTSPVRALGSKRPLEMLRTRVETEAVLDLISQLERGVLA